MLSSAPLKDVDKFAVGAPRIDVLMGRTHAESSRATGPAQATPNCCFDTSEHKMRQPPPCCWGGDKGAVTGAEADH